MNKIAILIVEDNVLVAEDLASTLSGYGYFSNTVTNGKDALDYIEAHRPDVVLMDIHIKGSMDGIGTAEKIRARFSMPLIYLTAHSDSSTIERAILTSPEAYITKPFEEKDLQIAIQLAIQNFSNGRRATDQTPASVTEDHFVLRDQVFIKSDSRFYKLNLDEVLFLKADGSYTHVTTTSRNHIVSTNLQNLLLKLDDVRFLRIHRSFVVNLDRVESFESHTIYVEEHELPISRRYKDSVFEKLRPI